MADRRSIELLAYNFANRTFAYRGLAQGLSRALSAFSSFMREYRDSVINADQCAQYVDEIGIAANTTEQVIRNIRAVFKCINQNSRTKSDHRKMPLWSNASRLPRKNHHCTQSSPAGPKSQKLYLQSSFPKIQKTSSKRHWLRKLLPKLHTVPVRKTH